MNFTKAARDLENCVVAIVQKFHTQEQPFPSIIGTGFFVSEHGVICTNQHVLNACLALPAPPDSDELPFWAAQWREVIVAGKPRWGWFPMHVDTYGGIVFTGDKPKYVGDATPDVAFLLAEFRDTPTVTLANDEVEIGEPIGFLGYPMGN